MIKRVILLFVIVCYISACASFQSSVSSSQGGQTQDQTDDEASISNMLVAYPFMALGAIMMGFGALFTVSFDAENSETESQSEAENGLIGLGLLGGGYLLWELGNQIEE